AFLRGLGSWLHFEVAVVPRMIDYFTPSTRGPFVDTEHVENHDRHADADRRIGDIERPEVIRAPVDIDEIHHRAGGDARDQVPRRATDDERQAKASSELMGREAG